MPAKTTGESVDEILIVSCVGEGNGLAKGGKFDRVGDRLVECFDFEEIGGEFFDPMLENVVFLIFHG